jgi:hypothetical protein
MWISVGMVQQQKLVASVIVGSSDDMCRALKI